MHRNTSTQRLIGDKGLELCEAPGVECCALRPTSLDPRANVRALWNTFPSARMLLILHALDLVAVSAKNLILTL